MASHALAEARLCVENSKFNEKLKSNHFDQHSNLRLKYYAVLHKNACYSLHVKLKCLPYYQVIAVVIILSRTKGKSNRSNR